MWSFTEANESRYSYIDAFQHALQSWCIIIWDSILDTQVALEEADEMLKGIDVVGLEVVTTATRGREVITTIQRKKGDYLCNYIGELLTAREGKKKVKLYDETTGCFMYFFKT